MEWAYRDYEGVVPVGRHTCSQLTTNMGKWNESLKRCVRKLGCRRWKWGTVYTVCVIRESFVEAVTGAFSVK